MNVKNPDERLQEQSQLLIYLVYFNMFGDT